jgi:hypothetical protein
MISASASIASSSIRGSERTNLGKEKFKIKYDLQKKILEKYYSFTNKFFNI